MGFLSKRRNKIIKEEIEKAYLLKGKLHDTNIYWQAFERFAQEYGGMKDRYADGGQDTAFEMKIHDDDIFDGDVDVFCIFFAIAVSAFTSVSASAAFIIACFFALVIPT